MHHLKNQSDFFLDLSLISVLESSLGVDPLRLSISILLFEKFNCLLNWLVMRFGIVPQLIVISFRNVHCDNLLILLLLEESLLVFGLEDVPSFILKCLVQSGLFGLILSETRNTLTEFFLISILIIFHVIFFIFLFIGVLFLFYFSSLL